MSSELKVNKVSPESGTGVQLGDSGDTITIPAGATISNNGTANGFGGGGVAAHDTQVITSTGTYTPTAGTTFVQVYCIGAGGGGGGAVTTNNFYFGSGGGGGAGGCAMKIFNATELGSSAAVTIGAAGSGGSGAAGSNNGTAGGDTTFNPQGSGPTLTGGGGGAGGGVNFTPVEALGGVPGTGGTASGGDINMKGENGIFIGEKGRTASGGFVAITCPGGASFWGGSQQIQTVGSNAQTGGIAGVNGSGGSGAAGGQINGGGAQLSGGNGGAGVVVIFEYQ